MADVTKKTVLRLMRSIVSEYLHSGEHLGSVPFNRNPPVIFLDHKSLIELDCDQETVDAAGYVALWVDTVHH